MAVPKVSSTTSADGIINYLKYKVTKTTLKDISLILHPCCSAILTISNWNCQWSGEVYGVLFTGVTISDPTLANQTSKVFLEPLNYDSKGASGFVEITFDSKGNWSGNIQTSIEGCTFPSNPFNLELQVSILPENLTVYHTSNILTFSITNFCC